jgi:hypothetical protein
MLEEFDPMCDDVAFKEKQSKINEALSFIGRAEELRIRDDERRRTQQQYVPPVYNLYEYGAGGAYFPGTQTYRYPTIETTNTTGTATITWTYGANP